MVAPRYAGTEPLTGEMLNSMFGRECDGSSTDSWESVEGVHGPVFGSNPDYSFAEHCDEMGLPSGERNAYLQRLEDRHSRAAEQC
jgi:hypothetical protein